MPHATTNGEKNSSQFIDRLAALPAVDEGIQTFKSNPYGKKSLEVADNVYARFGKPVEPYLETPYGYAKPYVQKVDELAASGLGHVENHFPIVTKDTSTIIETSKSYAFWPYNYVSSTYSDEYSKTAKHNGRGGGVITSVLALVCTELRITSDFFQAVAEYLGPKYEEGKKKGSNYLKEAQDTAGEYAQAGQDKFNELSKAGQKNAEQLKGDAKNLGNQAKGKAEELKGDAQNAGEQAKGKAEELKGDAKGKAEEVKGEAKKATK